MLMREMTLYALPDHSLGRQGAERTTDAKEMFLEKLSTYYILQLGVSNSDSSWVPTLCQMLLSFHFHHNLSQASWRLMFQIHTFQQMMGKI